MNGILNLYKPSGITSQTAVSIVKRVFGVKKAGHTGTLDPMASGVLPILVGSAVKLSEYMICDGKKYRTKLQLGITTDTEDTTGKVLTKSDFLPDKSVITQAVMSFVGEYMQIPPMYSAIKKDGKKLYEIARLGGEIEREPRRVVIESIEIHEIGQDFCEFSVSCSKGTYIRTLCADIGKKLGCGGAMASLERLEAGGFELGGSITLEALKETEKEQLEKTLVSIEDFFDGLERIRLNPFFSTLALNGAHVFTSKIKENLSLGQRVLLYTCQNNFFALGEVMEIEGEMAVKPIKMFFTASDF
ncbi:MAG: tRNA pseudouridine(55) synthase TruB [Ruminococcaceae bacterium]|nr:tRNA pseudouridine(55) synthase TruB [Oscillospiraceae bacterium]